MYRNKGAEREGEGDRHSGVGGETQVQLGGLSRASCAEAWRKPGRSLGMMEGRASKLDLLTCFWLEGEKER